MMQIPNYQIHEEIGKGRLATVYHAVQTSLERSLALKVMSPLLLEDSRFPEKFVQQNRIIARLAHPNIINIYDIGTAEDQQYLVMEKLSGGSLTEHIEQGLDIDQIFDLLQSVADALSHAHKQGIVHGDIRPQNILFHDDGRVVVTDFGITPALANHPALSTIGSATINPVYMSPEQARGKPADQYSDQYSLGVVLYECLTQQVPYQSDNPVELGLMHIKQPPPSLPQGYELFQPLLDKLMAKKPKQRFASDEELLDAIDALEREYQGDPAIPVIYSKARSGNNGIAKVSLAFAAGLAIAVFAVIIMDLLRIDFIPTQLSAVAENPTKPATTTAATTYKDISPSSVKTADDTPRQTASTDAEPQPLSADQLTSQILQSSNEESDINTDDTGSSVEDLNEELANSNSSSDETIAAEDELGPIALVSIDTETDIEEVIDTVYSEQQVDVLLAEAQDNLIALRLTTPYSQSALARYREVLEIDPANQVARQGLYQIALRYLALAQEKLANGEVNTSLSHVERGLSVVPNHIGLLALRDQINASIQEQADSETPQNDNQTAASTSIPEPPQQTRPFNQIGGWGDR